MKIKCSFNYYQWTSDDFRMWRELPVWLERFLKSMFYKEKVPLCDRRGRK